MSQSTYAVTGMTCDHCVASVKQEIGTIAGVRSVDVALVKGGESTVTVTSEAPLADTDVRTAVDEAGYELVGAA